MRSPHSTDSIARGKRMAVTTYRLSTTVSARRSLRRLYLPCCSARSESALRIQLLASLVMMQLLPQPVKQSTFLLCHLVHRMKRRLLYVMRPLQLVVETAWRLLVLPNALLPFMGASLPTMLMMSVSWCWLWIWDMLRRRRLFCVLVAILLLMNHPSAVARKMRMISQILLLLLLPPQLSSFPAHPMRPLALHVSTSSYGNTLRELYLVLPVSLPTLAEDNDCSMVAVV
mmetsp:Transcript_9343/g.20011  ORF Transcript_9343/g.20011 Transcript_9343/m.20011 type:complete len:229 (-) Transcript_9343:2936-3622(-)